MITKIGTPAIQRTISRSIGLSLRGWGGNSAARVAENEPGRDRVVAMVPAPQRGPPCGAEREDQACGRDEPGEDPRAARLVGSLARGIERLVHTPLGFQLRYSGALRNELHQVGAVLAGQGAVDHGAR